jgi:hypothetical protein
MVLNTILFNTMDRLEILRRFQKCLRRATAGATSGECAAAEAAARRLMVEHDIDPIPLPTISLYDRTDFSDNALLIKLRDEWRAAHPDYLYKADRDGHLWRVNTKRKPARPDPTSAIPKPKAKLVFNTKPSKPSRPSKPSSDRNRDRHSPGYMREYMRDYMRRRRAERPT